MKSLICPVVWVYYILANQALVVGILGCCLPHAITSTPGPLDLWDSNPGSAVREAVASSAVLSESLPPGPTSRCCVLSFSQLHFYPSLGSQECLDFMNLYLRAS